MIITKESLRVISPSANDNLIACLAPSLSHWLPIYGITDKLAAAMFLGQAAEETDGFKTLEEYASGAAYEGRVDLGNNTAGDGKRYKGRGIFMVTGRFNYATAKARLGLDLINHPELLLVPDNAVKSACDYWTGRNLSPMAMANNIEGVTRKINGGLNGLTMRKVYWVRATLVMTENLSAIAPPPPKPVPQQPPTAPKPVVAPPKPPATGLLASLYAWLLRTFPKSAASSVSRQTLIQNPIGELNMNFLNGIKTYLLSAFGAGGVIVDYFSGGMPLQQAAIYGLSLLLVMALRHGISSALMQGAANIATKGAALTEIKADDTLATIVQAAVAKALADAGVKPAEPAAEAQPKAA